MSPRLWRMIAIAIAIAAFVDPGVTRTSSTPPIIAVVPATARDDATAADVRRELRSRFAVVDGVLPGSAGTIVVGNRIPDSPANVTSPTFAVAIDSTESRTSIVDVVYPSHAPLNSRVRMDVRAFAQQPRGDSIVVTLYAGDAIIDRATRPVPKNNRPVTVPVWFVPASVGARHLRVSADVNGGSASDADVLVDVQPERWPVLFFDRRPSWMSTFVRRAVERDPRFIVTSRVVTSRNVSTDAGQPPESFDAVAATDAFDAVVVGAPELLTDRDIAGLDAFMRRRGGSVVMLFDTRQDGRYERLTQVQRWSIAADSALVLGSGEPESGTLRSSELAWPSALPAGAERVVGARSSRDSTTRAIIWRSSIGAGRLIVSGALDAWAYRDTASSGFDEFWRRTIAEAADATPAPMVVRIADPVAEPEARVDVDVIVRTAALGGATNDSVAVTASIEPGEAREAVRLWPTTTNGLYRGTMRVPAKAGAYRVVATFGAQHVSSSLVVAPGAVRVAADERDILQGWVVARGGRVVPRAMLSRLADIVSESIAAEARSERWHPMRSAWWIIPFALSLGAEWWWRRRRSLS